MPEVHASVKEEFPHVRHGIRDADGSDLFVPAKDLVTQDRKDLVVGNDDFGFVSYISRKAESAVFNSVIIELLHINPLSDDGKLKILMLMVLILP